jgi:DNA-binding response OmpR family regulator
MPRVLVVDDERDLVWALRRHLSNEDYEVLSAYDGMEALETAQRQHPDLIILDIVMPRLDGLQVCSRLRQDSLLATVPILFLTVRKDIADRIVGLDKGGDDYLTKPFDLNELRARVRALLRRSRASSRKDEESGDQDVLTVGSLTLDVRTRRVRAGDRVIQLTPIELNLLRHLMIHAGEVLPSRQLMQQVWGGPSETVNADLVRWHIKNLREKIEPDPTNPLYVRTLPRHGYILTV